MDSTLNQMGSHGATPTISQPLTPPGVVGYTTVGVILGLGQWRIALFSLPDYYLKQSGFIADKMP